MAIIQDPGLFTQSTKVEDDSVKLYYFFRTRDQYDALEEYTDKLNRQAYAAMGKPQRNWGSMFGPDPVSLYCQVRDFDDVWRKMPKRKPGKKRYEVRVCINETLFNDGIAQSIVSLGLEPKDMEHNKPRYTEGNLTSERLVVKSTKHFKKLTKLMNRDYGHNNWHLRGARKLYKRLATIETAREMGTPHLERIVRRGDATLEEVQKGIGVNVCVVGDAPTLKRKIFQLELMT